MSMFSTAERLALDRVAVPAMRAALAGEIVAAATGGAAARARARGGWRRHGRVLIGAGALVIASATAAATGLFDRLPIHIPGISHVAEAPVAAKPKHVVRVAKPREPAGRPAALAGAPLAAPAPLPPLAPPQQWRERRAARIAAGLPVRRPLLQRAIAARLRAMPPAERRAALAEVRRIRALPPEERRVAVARVKAEYLARHPRLAQRYEQRLEARAAAAASGNPPPAAAAPAGPPAAGPANPDQRAERRRQWRGLAGYGPPPAAPPQGASPAGPLTPDQRIERRQQWREWRIQRRAQRQQGGFARPRGGFAPPQR